MTVIKDQAYVLVNNTGDGGADYDAHMHVYALDLQTWHWTKLAAQDNAPTCRHQITPVVVQVSKHHCSLPLALTSFPLTACAVTLDLTNPVNLLLKQVDLLANSLLYCCYAVSTSFHMSCQLIVMWLWTSD